VLQESSTYGSQAQFEQAKLWRLTNLVLGTSAATLAAIAGAAQLASVAGATTTAYLALGAAALGAIATTLGASKRAEEARIAGNGYLGVRNSARRLREIGVPDAQTLAEAREEFDTLCEREDEINKLAPLPSRFAFWRARRNIDKGRTSFEVDQ